MGANTMIPLVSESPVEGGWAPGIRRIRRPLRPLGAQGPCTSHWSVIVKHSQYNGQLLADIVSLMVSYCQT